jgi:hypothetical protein
VTIVVTVVNDKIDRTLPVLLRSAYVDLVAKGIVKFYCWLVRKRFAVESGTQFQQGEKISERFLCALKRI